MKKSAIITLIAALILSLSACKKDNPRRDRPRDPSPPNQEQGMLNFKSTTGKNVVENPNDTFHIPTCGSGGKLGYVVARHPAPISGTMSLKYTFEASPDAVVVDYEDHTKTPGNMALFFQRQGDDYSQSKYGRGYRQWSLARQKLEPGDHVFEVVLTPDKWNFGHADFDATMREVENVGFTLAGLGGASAGHGVCMKTGTASITVKEVVIK